MTPQDSQVGGASEPQQIQDQNVEYEIIIEHDEPLLESNGPLVESEENPFKALDASGDKEGAEDIVAGNETNGTRVRRRPSQYSPDFRSQRYDETSDQIHTQVDDVTKIKLPKVRKCDKFDHVVHSVMM